jgi:hypothetical protein
MAFYSSSTAKNPCARFCSKIELKLMRFSNLAVGQPDMLLAAS